jgi:hypothetical protein
VMDGETDVILGCPIDGPEAPRCFRKLPSTKAQCGNTCALHSLMAEELVILREKQPQMILSVALTPPARQRLALGFSSPVAASAPPASLLSRNSRNSRSQSTAIGLRTKPKPSLWISGSPRTAVRATATPGG